MTSCKRGRISDQFVRVNGRTHFVHEIPQQRDRLADGGGHETRQHRKPSDMACSEGARREKALTLKRLKSGYVGQLTKRYNEVQNIMERSCDNSAIDVVLKIKDKILLTFEVYQECHAEHVEFLVDDKEKDDAQKAYHVECDTRQKMDQMVNSWIAKIKGKYKELPQIEADDSISHVSSKASTTASKMKLRAKAKHTVALLKLKQLEEQQALQDKIDEVEITMKLDEAMKLNKMKRKQAFLDARHEVQIRNAEYEVYERSEFRNETLETLETLNNDETLEKESAVKELQTKRNIDSESEAEEASSLTDLLQDVVNKNSSLHAQLKNGETESVKALREVSKKIDVLANKLDQRTGDESSTPARIGTKRVKSKPQTPKQCRCCNGSDQGGYEKCPYSKAEIRVALSTYYKSLKDNKSRKPKKDGRDHKTTCRRQNRLREGRKHGRDAVDDSHPDQHGDHGEPEEPRPSQSKDLFACPEDGCIKTYMSHGRLEQHMMYGKHEYRLEKMSLLDKAKIGYAERLEAGAKGSVILPTKTSKERCHQLSSQGWALHDAGKTRKRFSEKQKEYLKKTYLEGERTGNKRTGDDVAKEMR
ncbi:hypothetical protein AC249_AIPGENE19872 [Exaiptasia diaphana]|nr:hypothetical protein AC249_AIPGENE19872 [Exaiptasia diaphana]